jgi:Ankyrin repeats (3 copies)
MPAFPTLESLLLRAHQALGVAGDGSKLKTDDKALFADIGLSEERQRAITARLLADIQSVFDLDDESNAYFFKHLIEWSNHHKHLELNTWTAGASDRQIAWYLASRSIIPPVAQVLAFWDLDGALAPGMPTGQFWFLPTVDSATGRLELPLPKVVDWLIDLYGLPISQVQHHLGSDEDAKGGRQDFLLRNLYNWKAGKLPRVASISDMFPTEDAVAQAKAFRGAFTPDPSTPIDRVLAEAFEFIRRKEIAAEKLSQQIAFPNVGRLSAVLGGSGTVDENDHFVRALRARYAVPSQQTIRQRMLMARAVQSAYLSICEALCPEVEPSSTDPSRNKVLQLLSVFTRVFNLTISAHGQASGAIEEEEDRVFEASLTPFERHDLLLAIVPSRKHVSHLQVPSQWSRRFMRMSADDPLEDLMPTHPDGIERFVQTAVVRLIQEEDEDRRVAEVADRCQRSSPWRALQDQGFDVLRRIVGMDGMPPRARTLACERLLEVAEVPAQKAEAALQLALNLLASEDRDRSAAVASRVDGLLGLARDALAGTHHELLLLATEAKQMLRKGQLKAAQDQYRKALAACSNWGCGRLRGEIARDLLALEVADAALPTEEHSAVGRYYRNMVAFGMFEAGAPGLEDTAIWAHDYFWKDLFKPYQGTPSIRASQTIKSQGLLLQFARRIMQDSGFNVQAWLDQNRKVLSKPRLRDVRGDSALTFLLKFMANLRDLAPPELVERMRSFLLALIAAWPEQVNMSDFKAQTALMLAANDGEVKIVRSLLSGGEDVDAQDYLGRTALHSAVTGGSLSCVELLLAAGPDIQRTTFDESQSVLHTAVRIGDLQIVSALAHALPELLTATNMHGDTPRAEAQSVLDHYDQYRSMMERQTSRSPATRSAMMEIVALLQRLDPASVDGAAA